jgi:hypothetical protein
MASRAESFMLILRHDSSIRGSGEVLEEREIHLADRLLSRRGVLKGRGNAYGCFIEQGSFVRLSEWVESDRCIARLAYFFKTSATKSTNAFVGGSSGRPRFSLSLLWLFSSPRREGEKWDSHFEIEVNSRIGSEAWKISADLADGKTAPRTPSKYHPTPYGKWAV